MSYCRSCLWCRKTFDAKRKDNVYCSPKCRLKRFQIYSEFNLVEEMLPEAEIQEKYYSGNSVVQKNESFIYLQWYRDKSTGSRFADVYLSKSSDIDKMEKKHRKKGIPIRYTDRKTTN
jgi:hypothetical protein